MIHEKTAGRQQSSHCRRRAVSRRSSPGASVPPSSARPSPFAPRPSRHRAPAVGRAGSRPLDFIGAETRQWSSKRTFCTCNESVNRIVFLLCMASVVSSSAQPEHEQPRTERSRIARAAPRRAAPTPPPPAPLCSDPLHSPFRSPRLNCCSLFPRGCGRQAHFAGGRTMEARMDFLDAISSVEASSDLLVWSPSSLPPRKVATFTRHPLVRGRHVACAWAPASDPSLLPLLPRHPLADLARCFVRAGPRAIVSSGVGRPACDFAGDSEMEHTRNFLNVQ